MLKRLEIERQKTKEQLKGKKSNKNSIGLLEIISSIAARHPSINSINIKELNYFQLIDQFQRINKIDDWELNMKILASGYMSPENQKEIKHYTAKIDET